MNASQAKQIPIMDYLDRKGYRIVRTFNKNIQYQAAYRGERKGSLMVSKDGYAFKDWGTGAHGTIIDLAMLVGGCHTVSAALQDIERTMGGRAPISIRPMPAASPSPKYQYHVMELQAPELVAYASARGIPEGVLRAECVEVHIGQYRYIGFGSCLGGYELRNGGPKPWDKRCVGPKGISTRGSLEGSTCLVFEGFFDYLAAMTMGWLPAPEYSAVVLNSTSLVQSAIPHLRAAHELHLWLDDDEPGQRAACTLLAAHPCAFDMSGRGLLCGAKDVADFFLFNSKMEK